MNVIFVPADISFQNITFTNSSFSTMQYNYDAVSGLKDFNSLWCRIDNHTLSYIDVREQTLADKFWDRVQFITFIEQICAFDVYIKTGFNAITLYFFSHEDYIKFNEKICARPSIDTLYLKNSLKLAVQTWLFNNSIYDYRIAPTHSDTFKLQIRDQHYMTMATIKFKDTTADCHQESVDDVPF